MSLATSLLLAFLPAIVRPKPEAEKSARELELEAELSVMRSELDLAWAERDSALRRLDEARDMLARVASERIDQRLGALGLQQTPYGQNALAQQANMAMMQQQNAQAQNAQMQALMAQYQAAQNAWPHCHCVPGRHEAMLGGVLGA